MIGEALEWESPTTRLVKLIGLERAPTWPENYKRTSNYYERSRAITEVIIHQSAGPRRDGLDAPSRLASWIVKPPKFRATASGKLRRVGGGRGFPGCPYTFVIPTRPAMVDGKLTVYRIWGDDWHTWHTKGHNHSGVGIVLCGYFQSRHDPGSPRVDPDSTAVAALESLVLDYLLPKYNLGADALRSHAELGKPACPGDMLEEWVMARRGEATPDHSIEWSGPLDDRPLLTWRQKQEALVALGFDPGPVDGIPGPLTRMAIESLQADMKLHQDGILGPRSERAMRFALAQLG